MNHQNTSSVFIPFCHLGMSTHTQITVPQVYCQSNATRTLLVILKLYYQPLCMCCFSSCITIMHCNLTRTISTSLWPMWAAFYQHISIIFLLFSSTHTTPNKSMWYIPGAFVRYSSCHTYFFASNTMCHHNYFHSSISLKKKQTNICFHSVQECVVTGELSILLYYAVSGWLRHRNLWGTMSLSGLSL